jgi:GMP synthase (glutamine-hydrolysing)
MTNKILIFDFGSQYTQLIARRIRELNVYSEIVPFNKQITLTPDIKGVVLSGSPFSVTDQRALHIDLAPFIGKVPVLGVCYGAQYLAHYYGGKVEPSTKREYGKAFISSLQASPILHGIVGQSQVWMSHGDTITAIPEGFERIAHTESIEVAAYQSVAGRFQAPVYCLQFHPEVTHSLDGAQILHNFVIGVCQCQPDWTPQSFVEDTILQLRQTLQDDHVLMALSGGVDSTVAAVLLHRAIGHRLHCFFVDNGLLRKDEYESVLASYEGMGLNIKGVQAANVFFDALKGLTNPEDKRKAIGRLFIEVFEAEAHTLPEVAWLGQGTIYPDVIESVSVHGPSVTIKSHHNVGGLPDRLRLKIVEPLRMLFKDEVRRVGRSLQISSDILDRHPFPGPGLGIRILGEVTPAKVQLLQQADHIFIGKLRQHNLYNQVWQAGAVLLPVQSVGVMGDERTYELTVALRCVNSSDGMTAEWSKLPHEFLAEVSNEIINSVKGINRVVYDISTKPPATIEWE